MKLTILESTPIRVTLIEDTPIVIPVTVKEVGKRLPNYEGTYVVTPTIGEQFLATKNTSMIDDVTVNGIPYQEVSNPSGLTVTIGGN